MTDSETAGRGYAVLLDTINTNLREASSRDHTPQRKPIKLRLPREISDVIEKLQVYLEGMTSEITVYFWKTDDALTINRLGIGRGGRTSNNEALTKLNDILITAGLRKPDSLPVHELTPDQTAAILRSLPELSRRL